MENDLVDRALARSIPAAAVFFKVADEPRAYMTKTHYVENSYLVGISGDYVPSDEWKAAVVAFYKSLSREILRELQAVENSERLLDGSEMAWKVSREEPFEPWGWVHRVILVMNYARRINGQEPDLGDPEFSLMMSAIVESE